MPNSVPRSKQCPRPEKKLAGVAANLGKPRVYNCVATAAPPGISELGPGVRRGNKPVEGAVCCPWHARRRPGVCGPVREGVPRAGARLAGGAAAAAVCLAAAPLGRNTCSRRPTQAHDHAVWDNLQALLGERGTHTAPGAHARRLASAPVPPFAPHAPASRRRGVAGVRRCARCFGGPKIVGAPRHLA